MLQPAHEDSRGVIGGWTHLGLLLIHVNRCDSMHPMSGGMLVLGIVLGLLEYSVQDARTCSLIAAYHPSVCPADDQGQP